MGFWADTRAALSAALDKAVGAPKVPQAPPPPPPDLSIPQYRLDQAADARRFTDAQRSADIAEANAIKATSSTSPTAFGAELRAESLRRRTAAAATANQQSLAKGTTPVRPRAGSPGSAEKPGDMMKLTSTGFTPAVSLTKTPKASAAPAPSAAPSVDLQARVSSAMTAEPTGLALKSDLRLK